MYSKDALIKYVSVDQSPISRRSVLAGGISAALTTGFSVAPATASGGETMLPLDELVLRVVRQKFANFHGPLNVLLPEGSAANLAPIIATFEAGTAVKIALTEVGTDGIVAELMLDSMSNAQKYDVALPATYSLSDLVVSNAVLPLDAFQQTYEPEGFREGILFNGGDHFGVSTYGFQTDGDAYLMFTTIGCCKIRTRAVSPARRRLPASMKSLDHL